MDTSKPLIAANQPVSHEQIMVPLSSWLTGSAIMLMIALGGIVWRMAIQKSRIDANAEAIKELKESRDKFKDELRLSFKQDIASSANDICHGFELFAVEIRGTINTLKNEIDSLKTSLKGELGERDAVLSRIARQSQNNLQSLYDLESKLNQNNIDFHLRSDRLNSSIGD